MEERKRNETSKEAHRRQVREQMEMREEDKRTVVLKKINENEKKVEKTKEKVKTERVKKAEEAAIKREDRVENVNRISKMNEYTREQLLEKIEADNEKSRKVQMEKQALLTARSQLRRDIEQQKSKVLEEFERMKKKGKLDVIFILNYNSLRNWKSWECHQVSRVAIQGAIRHVLQEGQEAHHLIILVRPLNHLIITAQHKTNLLQNLLNQKLIKVFVTVMN